MPYLKTSPPGTGNAAWDAATAYAVGAGVTTTAFDHIPGAGLRFVCIAANTGAPPTLSAADPNWRLAHPVNAFQFFNAIAALTTSADFNGAGNAWTRAYRLNALGGLLASASQRFVLTFTNTGDSGQDTIVVPLYWQRGTSTAPTAKIRILGAAQWQGNTGGQDDQLFRGAWASGTAYAAGDVVSTSSNAYWWVCVAAHTAATTPSAATPQWVQLPSNAIADAFKQPNTYTSTAIYHTLWEGGSGDIPLWFFSSRNRLMWVAQSDTRFTFAYAGFLRRFGTQAQVPAPLVLGGNDASAANAYDSTTLCNLPRTAAYPSYFLDSSGSWHSISSSYAQIMPFGILEGGLNVGGQYGLEEAVFYGVNSGLMGSLEGVHCVSSKGQSSGNELAAGADSFVVFEDVYRGQTGGFFALKKV